LIDRTDRARAQRSTLLVAVVLALLAAWRIYAGARAGTVLAAAAVILFICAAIPGAAVVFDRWWMRLARVLGYVNGRIILSLLYFLVVTPIGIVVRLSGHDPLERRTGASGSHWRKRTTTRQKREEYERAF
jgi:saxitoxin biosynthesis operon SxtJ-like protein